MVFTTLVLNMVNIERACRLDPPGWEELEAINRVESE